jgi:hypothetical protein
VNLEGSAEAGVQTRNIRGGTASGKQRRSSSAVIEEVEEQQTTLAETPTQEPVTTVKGVEDKAPKPSPQTSSVPEYREMEGEEFTRKQLESTLKWTRFVAKDMQSTAESILELLQLAKQLEVVMATTHTSEPILELLQLAKQLQEVMATTHTGMAYTEQFATLLSQTGDMQHEASDGMNDISKPSSPESTLAQREKGIMKEFVAALQKISLENMSTTESSFLGADEVQGHIRRTEGITKQLDVSSNDSLDRKTASAYNTTRTFEEQKERGKTTDEKLEYPCEQVKDAAFQKEQKRIQDSLKEMELKVSAKELKGSKTETNYVRMEMAVNEKTTNAGLVGDTTHISTRIEDTVKSIIAIKDDVLNILKTIEATIEELASDYGHNISRDEETREKQTVPTDKEGSGKETVAENKDACDNETVPGSMGADDKKTVPGDKEADKKTVPGGKDADKKPVTGDKGADDKDHAPENKISDYKENGLGDNTAENKSYGRQKSL